AGLLAGFDDRHDREIRLSRRRRADRDRFVGLLDVQRLGVGFGIDRHGLDAHAARGADHAARDLAAIGDEDLLEHVFSGASRHGYCRLRAANSAEARPLASVLAAWRATLSSPRATARTTGIAGLRASMGRGACASIFPASACWRAAAGRAGGASLS